MAKQTSKYALNINSTTRLFSQCCGKSHDILWCTDRHLTWEDCKIGRQLYMTAIFHLETKLLDLSRHVVSACVYVVHVNQDGRFSPLLKWKKDFKIDKMGKWNAVFHLSNGVKHELLSIRLSSPCTHILLHYTINKKKTFGKGKRK